MSLENVIEFMKSCNLEDRLMVFELSIFIFRSKKLILEKLIS